MPSSIMDHQPDFIFHSYKGDEAVTSNIDPGMLNMQRYLYDNPVPVYFDMTPMAAQFPMDAISPIPLLNHRYGSPDSSKQSGAVSSPGEVEITFPPTPPAVTASPLLEHQDPAIFEHFNLSSFTNDPGYLDSALVPTAEHYYESIAGTYNPMNRGFSLNSCSSSSYEETSVPPRPARSDILASHHSIIAQQQQQHQQQQSSSHETIGLASQATVGLPTTPMSTSTTPVAATSIYPPPDERPECRQEHLPTLRDSAKFAECIAKKKPSTRSHKRKASAASSYHKDNKRSKAASLNDGMMSPTSPPLTPRIYATHRPSHSTSCLPTIGYQGPLSGPVSSQPPLHCPECPGKTYTDSADLSKHMRQQHTRPFVCVFDFAGCTSTFASKNEWKRHVQSQHLLLSYWLCQAGCCAKVENAHCETIPHGAIFNRKDLYTQHVRRMHTPRDSNNINLPTKKKSSANTWRKPSSGNTNTMNESSSPPPSPAAIALLEDRLKNLQAEAHRDRCSLPTHMSCPVASCNQEFSGNTAWDDRMEHVAKHLEQSATRRVEGLQIHEEDEAVFGGPNDASLLRWAARDDIAVIKQTPVGSYQLWNPLKGEPGSVGSGTGRKNSSHYQNAGASATASVVVPVFESEEDAEGDVE